ncbi:MAG: MarR family winged helix-turn-helix transcriptional regulator [Crocinitomicaceae bacterium]
MKIEEAIQSKIDNPHLRAVVNVRYTSNWMSTIQNKFMSKFSLTMPQFNILRILRGAKEAITVNTVKQRMVEKSPNTTRLMDKLIDKGLIERERCSDDRRVVYVKISEEGLKLLSTIDKALQDSGKEILVMENLTEEEACQLSDLLDKLRG